MCVLFLLLYKCTHITLTADTTQSLITLLIEEFPPSECMLITIGQPKSDIIARTGYVECHDGSNCLAHAKDTKLYCAIYLWYNGEIESLKTMPYQPLVTKSILINLLSNEENSIKNRTFYYIPEVKFVISGKVIIHCTNGRVYHFDREQKIKIGELCTFPWEGMVWKFAYWVSGDFYS